MQAMKELSKKKDDHTEKLATDEIKSNAHKTIVIKCIGIEIEYDKNTATLKVLSDEGKRKIEEACEKIEKNENSLSN